MNEVVRTMMRHRSIRKFQNRMPSRQTINAIVRAGQQASFASQLYSVIVSRDRAKQA